MSKQRLQDCLRELATDTQHMSEEQQGAFVAMLPLLSKLYRVDAKCRAVLIIATEDSQTLLRINADEYEAHGILYNAVPFHESLLRAGMSETIN